MSAAHDPGALLALFVAGFAIERFPPVESVRRSIPSTLRTVLGGLAFGGPWLLSVSGYVPDVVVSAVAVTLACTFVLWFAIPVVTAPFVGTRAASHC